MRKGPQQWNSFVHRNSTVPIAALLLVLAAACEASSPSLAPAAVEVEFGPHEITLSLSPNEIADGPVKSRPMSLEWGFRSVEIEALGSIADIRLHGDQGLVIADWMSPQILLLHGPGSSPERIVGRGPGPGETGLLYSVLSTGSHIVGWGASSSRAFQVFQEDGTPRATVPIPVPGDWTFVLFRRPPVPWEPHQMTAEYTSERLARLDAEHFIHILQDDERRKDSAGMGVPIEDLWTSAILYDLDGQVQDTLARYPAPRTRYAEGHHGLPVQDMYAGRLRISGSDHHLAATHGDSAYVRIIPRNSTPGPDRWIRWRSFRPPLGADAVQHQVDLAFDLAFASDPEFVRMWRQESRARQRRELSDYFDELNHIPEAAPEVTKLWSDGTCVFLAGFRYTDSYDGTSSTIIGINLADDTHEVLTVSQPRFRIRDMHRGRVLVTTREDDDTWGVHVYRHGMSCH
ncbi:hypothetical protein BH23GEM11_BH23GEM11_01480 [soil metagenome]